MRFSIISTWPVSMLRCLNSLELVFVSSSQFQNFLFSHLPFLLHVVIFLCAQSSWVHKTIGLFGFHLKSIKKNKKKHLIFYSFSYQINFFFSWHEKKRKFWNSNVQKNFHNIFVTIIYKFKRFELFTTSNLSLNQFSNL